MKSKATLLISILVALTLLLGIAQASPSQAQTDTTIGFDPSIASAITCGTIDVDVVVNDVVDLTGYHLEVTYDRTKVQVVNVVNGGFLTDSITLPGLYEPTNTVDDGTGTGRILWGMAQRGESGDPDPKSGTGKLITITLKAKVATGSAALTIGGASILIDWPDAFEIPYAVAGNATVTLQSCAPTDITLSNATVEENKPVGTVVGALSATDPDPADTSFTYSLVDATNYPDNAAFGIVSNNLTTTAVFNYELKASYSIKIRATDPHGAFYDEVFTITVIDVNDAPVLAGIGPKSVPNKDTLSFTPTATDEDRPAQTFAWSLGAGAPTWVSIHPGTGVVILNPTISTPLGSYTAEICVSDGALSDCEEITITVIQIAIVSIVGDSFTIDGCGYIDLYIHVADVINLYAVDVTIQFDKSKVEVMDLDSSATGVNLEPVIDVVLGFNAQLFVHNEANNETGTIRFSASQINPAEPATGSGNIAKIRLRAKALATSPITVTAATLSDRDGYLVGVPLVLDTADVINTQFTAAGGLDLGITRLNATTVQLSWPKQTLDEDATYRLHKHSMPYFNIGDTGVQLITSPFADAGTTLTFNDPVLGHVETNYFYTMTVACESGLTSPPAWWVGKFEFTLYETTGTDYSLIGLNLELVNVTDTTKLALHIQNNSTVPLTVISVSKWNGPSQQFQTYTTDEPSDVQVKQPYQIEVEVTGSPNRAIWAQVGRLPIKTANTYTLRETTGTDYTWIVQPLYMTSITNTDDLMGSIDNFSSSGLNVISISKWNGTAQQFDAYSLGESSSTRFGYPYQVEADILTGTTVTWPTVIE